ncbi:MAG TPA: sensor domain-containing diguanylate cyclase [Gaiellaceae bacterium]|nr:sensor domain-containing diguanylate cyclase [Gaiellaceae bacterium]
MTDTHAHENPARPRGAGVAARDFASSLRSLLEITKAVRSGADVDSVLDAIARVVGETLGFQTVVLNVYRPEWDDFYVATVHGNDSVREALLGSVYEWGSWTPLLDDRFARAGAYFIPNDAFDWSQDHGNRFVPAGEPAVEGPEGWHPNDELFVPLEHSDGGIVGIMSFGDPVDGRRPDDGQLATAAALASHAALALEAAQERARSQRHQAGLEQLLHVTSQLPQTMSTEAMLTSVCEAVSEALGFDKVLIQLVDAAGRLRPAAAAGLDEAEVAATAVLELEPISRLFEPQFEIAGCYLVPRDEAARRVEAAQVVYRSTMNGRGPHAWDHHWLVVPLRDAGGAVRGVLWADEPHSRLLPSEHVLQALRIFANHAMEALAVATQLEETRFLADHDPLTRLLNRRALLRELAAATDRNRPVALVFLDVDNFKDVNDGHGHATGDRVLARFASLLVELVRSGDDAFRVGGDEFALLLRDAGEPEARDVVARIVAAIGTNIDPLVRTLSASFGIAPSAGAEEPEALLRVADEAMYTAKRSGTRVEVAA